MQADSTSIQTADTATTAEVAVPEPSDLAVRYHRSGNFLWAGATVLDLLVPAALLFAGLSARMRNLAARLARGRRFATIAIYAIAYVLIQALVFLPLSWYAGFVRQQAYGLSTEAASEWMSDWAKGVAVSAVVAALVLWIPYRLLRVSPRRWWLWTGLLTAPLTVLAMIVLPVYIAPLFDRYGRMRDRALEQRIQQLAARAGIPDSRIYEVKKSDETRRVNAYVTGFGGTKRIVLWDTLVDRLGPDEVTFVVGHEIGHFVLRHTLTVIVLATLLVTLSLYVVHRVSGWLIARFGLRFGFDRLDDVASLPLLALVGGIVILAATPAALALSRWEEREADRFGLEITRNNPAAGRAFVRLQEDNLAVPRTGLLFRLWRGSHPDLADRIEFANRYSPWLRGQPLRYGDRFAP
jgi:STE24 endopeptidase